MSQGQDESKKRGRRRYGGPRGKRARGSGELEVGMQGVLITCNMNERKCTAEAYDLLSEYAEQLYGPETFAEDSHSEEDGDDVEAALKREVAQIRTSTEKRERRFQALESGANNVVFIRTQGLDPGQLVHRILQDLHTTKKKKSRVILRMLPVCGTCKAFPEDMEKYLSTFLEPWFKTPNQASYQIVFKARNSSHNKRDDVIKSLAGLVGRLNPANKVNLTNPELTIIVEVIKSVCCVSVARDYVAFKKFNLQEVVKADGQPEPTNPAGNGGAEAVPAAQASVEKPSDEVPGEKDGVTTL
ncbi:LOW QUALITY PROTEIN: THUMP domain-containing protein 1 [Denticeps clupeoides]|uniref:LOW QUALITY PROTEIN: THUMP domain-containing protein 1 n=1 Tax=Denticeps clupeoides TaxID=299321 RepID=UPI0010A3B24C|nr:LOW QUALITY PROTEIN: THUMP domain-containing protein 1 [Denticeps clupeoides]